ncbi:MAG: hypothetical protein D6738_15070, partial [Acidobacteria bacterium]
MFLAFFLRCRLLSARSFLLPSCGGSSSFWWPSSRPSCGWSCAWWSCAWWPCAWWPCAWWSCAWWP